jgi:transcription elongation factor Elf1
VSKKKHKKKKIKVRGQKKFKYFRCVCCCCGHEWDTTVHAYAMFKDFGCEECGSIRYEADHPKFPDTLDERLDALGLPKDMNDVAA